jgi:TonB-dependent receptor
MTSGAIFLAGPQTAFAQQAAQQSYNIPSKDLGRALTDLARQNNREIYFSSDLTRGKTSRPLRGQMSAEQALSRLLDGSGLTFRVAPSGAITIEREVGNGAAGDASVAVINERTIAGTVVDLPTGAALKGALITIPQLGRSTRTDDLGEFRIPGLAPGAYRVEIEYLGYQGASRSMETGRAGKIALVSGSDDDLIVVYGQRSARAQALNQERTAENSTTILSADLLGQFDGTTIADSLRRAPGVAFQPSQSTGEGQNVIIRGLAPDFNTVTLNGLRLPVGNGKDRSPALNNILTDSIASIKINKTLLANQDGSGTGGLIEIETKGPLDRPRRYANISLERAGTGDDFLKEYLVGATISGKFGSNDNFGLSASVQYRKRRNSTISYSTGLDFGQYLPLSESGGLILSRNDVDPRLAFPFEPGVDEVYPFSLITGFNDVSLKDLSVTLSGQWKIAQHTNLRLDYTRAKQTRDLFQREFFLETVREYMPTPIPELGGEVRGAPIWEDVFADFGLPGALMSAQQSYRSQRNVKQITSTLSFQGETEFGPWSFDYGLGRTSGRLDEPESYNLSLVGDENNATFGFFDVTNFVLPEVQQNTLNGGMVSPFRRRVDGDNSFPLPLLTGEGFDLFNDPANYVTSPVLDLTSTKGKNTRNTARFSGRYTASQPWLDYIEAGVFYETSRSSAVSSARDSKQVRFAPGTTLADLGLDFSSSNLSAIGIDDRFMMIDPDVLNDFVRTAYAGGVPGTTILDLDIDPRIFQTYTKERDLAGYLQARVNIGNFEAIGGVRVENVRTSAVSLTSPRIFGTDGLEDVAFREANSTLVNQSASQVDFLPRIAINYRPFKNVVARFGYYSTIARPSLAQLNQDQSLTLSLRPIFGPENNQPQLQIFQGNPDLKPAVTHNFDLNLEWYFSDIGLVEAGIFYKDTRNLIFGNQSRGFQLLDGIVLPDDPRFQNLPDDIFVLGVKPQNSPHSARIWGYELSVERRFDFLPGALRGFGVYANYTYTDSSRSQELPFGSANVLIRGVPYNSQPKHSGTLALTYSGFGVDGSLAYTRQDRYLSAFEPHNLGTYQEAVDSLDLRLQYTFKLGPTDMRIIIEGSDLLRGPSEPDLETSRGGTGNTPRYFSGGRFIGGRSFRLGLSSTF